MISRKNVVIVLLLSLLSGPSLGAEAILAGGCFWCVQADFDKLPGVLKTIVGYDGSPSDKVEVVKITFDEKIISYEHLLDYFFRQIDPLTKDRQFCDIGRQYRTAIFTLNKTQSQAAKKVLARTAALFKPKPVYTEVVPSIQFHIAKSSHQKYYLKNPRRYKFYRYRCGRDRDLKKIWGQLVAPYKLSANQKAEKIKALSPLQYLVTQQEGTEQAYKNAYWHNNQEGIYVDVVSGEPLFSSTDKYDSKTGWPSFSKPIDQHFIITKLEKSLIFQNRLEAKSRYGRSHLGHVFKDGPKPLGLRYCINSAALQFIPKDKLLEQGYGYYLYLFKKNNP